MLAQATHRLREFPPDTPPSAAILDGVIRALGEAAGNLDGVRIEVVERGIKCGKRVVPSSSQGCTGLSEQMLSRGVRSAFFPRRPPKRDLWGFILTLAQPPSFVDEAGGALQALHSVGCTSIRIEEQPPLILNDSSPAVDPPETADAFVKITREIVQSFQLDGPDAVAMGLLMVWRQIATTHGVDGLPVQSVLKILPRLDPIVGFMVLARLAGTADGRAIAQSIPDNALATCIGAAVVARVPGVENSGVAVLATARAKAQDRLALAQLVHDRMTSAGRDNDEAWVTIRSRLGHVPDNPHPSATDKRAKPQSAAEKRVTSLVKKLRESEDRTERRQVCASLVEAGDQAVGPLVIAAREGPWYFLRNILKVLGEIGSRDAEGTALRLLRHSHVKVRTESIRALGKIGTKDCVKTLGRIAGMEGEKAQRDAFGAQGSHLDQQIVDTLRSEAIAVLGYSGIPQAVPILEQLLLSPQVNRKAVDLVRREAATALSAHGSDAAGQVLMDAVRNTNRAVRDATKEALQNRR